MGADLQLFIVDVGMAFGPFPLGRGQYRAIPTKASCLDIEEAILSVLSHGARIKTIALIDQVVEVTGCKRMSICHRLTFMKRAGAVLKHAGGYHQIGKDPDVKPDSPA